MPRATKKFIEQIETRVSNKERSVNALFERMDRDWDLYTLKKFIPRRGEGIRDEDAYTSNRPRIVADKLVGAVAAAKQIIRVQVDSDNQDEREINNNYERFAIGILRQADRIRERSGRTPIRTELAFRSITAGGYAATRALLAKDEDGNTIPSISVIHPRHLLIQMGAREPVWAAIVTSRARTHIRSEYPKFKFEDENDDEDDGDMAEKVIDYYWKEDGKYWNAVVINGQFARKPEDTYATMFPIVARAIGAHSGTTGVTSLSEFSQGDSTVKGIETFGESVFAPLRDINHFKNRLMSYKMAMAGKRVRSVMKVYSSGGTRELEGSIDEDTTEINLDVDNAEEIQPLEIQDLGRDVDSLAQFVTFEDADASLPEQSFGRLPAPISGNALRILGSSIGERLEPFIRPIESCIEGTIEVLAGMFESGKFEPIRVSGRTRSRLPFSRPISPEDIVGHDDIMVELEPDLPTDRQEAWLTAQLATTPGADGVPLASHLTAREDILKLQDSDLENQRIEAQKARMSMPKTILMTQLIAASQAGDSGTVQFLQQELQRIITNEAMQDVAQRLAFMQLLGSNPFGAAAGGVQGGPGGQAGPAPQGGGNPLAGIPPEFLGLSGIAPGSVAPSPEAGANTTGPRSTEQRANAIGLTLAR